MGSVAMDSRAVHDLIPSAVLTALAIVLVTARFCARARILGKLESSDWVVAAALVTIFFQLGKLYDADKKKFVLVTVFFGRLHGDAYRW
jgi:hypothetical protein